MNTKWNGFMSEYKMESCFEWIQSKRFYTVSEYIMKVIDINWIQMEKFYKWIQKGNKMYKCYEWIQMENFYQWIKKETNF